MTILDGGPLMCAIRNGMAMSEAMLHYDKQTEELRWRHDSLSGRERQVMALIVTGLLNKQVGHELGISEITVKAHRGKMMRKIGARSFAELVKTVASLQSAGSYLEEHYCSAKQLLFNSPYFPN